MSEERSPSGAYEPEQPSGPSRRPYACVVRGFVLSCVPLTALVRHALFPFLMAIYLAYGIEPVVTRAPSGGSQAP